MSKHIKIKDIRNALVELIDGGKWLERDTTMRILEALGDLPTIDIVHCKDCKWLLAEEGGCERIGMVLFAEEIENHFCGYGERKDNE